MESEQPSAGHWGFKKGWANVTSDHFANKNLNLAPKVT
jgi:hypothetical protein